MPRFFRNPVSRRVALVFCAIVPLLLSAVMHGAGPRPQPAPPTGPLPALAFRQYLIDLGRAPATDELQALLLVSMPTDPDIARG